MLDTQTVPQEVRERFVRVGNDYHFQNGQVAFRDRGKKLVSRSENTEVIRSLVEIALARGWDDITVSGSTRYRREAWRMGTVAGLNVRGYTPSAVDKARFVRDIAAARVPSASKKPPIDPVRQPTAFGRQDPSREAAALPHTEAPAVSSRRDRLKSSTHQSVPEAGVLVPGEERTEQRMSAPSVPDRARGAKSDVTRSSERIYEGTLLEHGRATFEFHPRGEPSYYLRLKTPEGEKVIWGTDLERAMNQSNAGTGDDVRVRQTGRKPVTVKQRQHDTAGRVVDEREIAAHRNHWEILRAGRRQGAPGLIPLGDVVRDLEHDPRLAAREHPELAGAVLAMQGAQRFAERELRDEATRARFLKGIREELAQALDRGETVPRPTMRERSRRIPPDRTMS